MLVASLGVYLRVVVLDCLVGCFVFGLGCSVVCAVCCVGLPLRVSLVVDWLYESCADDVFGFWLEVCVCC